MRPSPLSRIESRVPLPRLISVLRAEGLWIEMAGGRGAPFLRGIDLELPAGSLTVLLGETGAGKTLLARALSGLLPEGFRIRRGRIVFRGRVLDSPRSWEGIRGRHVFYAPQNAAACLNPVLTIHRQIRECTRMGEKELEALLHRLRFADPGRILGSHPFALSGGENQRCLLAMALASRAEVLILDEPTSEIDDDAQDEFVRALAEQQRSRPLTVLLISHHLGFIRGADRVCILSAGERVACGTPQEVFSSPRHPVAREIADCLATAL